MATKRCGMCKGIGWMIEANGAGMNEPVQLELIPCFHPECKFGSGEVEPPLIASLVFKGPTFTHAAKHPGNGTIMSVSAP